MKYGKIFLGLALSLILALGLAVTGASAAGTTVTLEADTAIGDITLPGAGEELILDLNGHTLTGSGLNASISLSGGLTIRDGSAGQTGRTNGCRFLIGSGGALTLESGTMTGTGSATSGGAAYVLAGGVFTMKGGSITGITSASGNSGAAVAAVGGTFRMEGGSITGCTSGANGGAVAAIWKDNVAGTVVMTGGEISGNTAGSTGGGVWVSGGSFTMEGGVITGNRAAGTGGGVCLNGGSFTMTGGTISGNECTGTTQAVSRGGGVYVKSGTFTMSDGVISDNAAYSAGAVGMEGGKFNMSGGSLTGNKAGTRNGEGALTGGGNGIGGGAIGTWGEAVRINVTGGSITDNRSFVQGGAVAIYAGQVSLENVTVSGNGPVSTGDTFGGAFMVGGTSASTEEEKKLHRLIIGEGTVVSGNGAGVEHASGKYLNGTAGYAGRGGEIVMNGGTVSGNDSAGANGVFFLRSSGPGHMTMTGGAITGNVNRGGTVWISAGADFTMTGGEISNNTAAVLVGGGVRAEGGTFTMTGGSISENKSLNKMSGGGLALLNSAVADISGGVITGNTAQGSGGGVYASGTAAITLSGDGVIANNSAETTNCEMFLSGNAHFFMTGGTLGARNSGRSALWAWSETESHMISADIYGGSVLNVMGASGTNTANQINLWGGRLHSISENHRGFTVYGGLFYDPSYVMECAGTDGMEISRTGDPVFGFELAPVLTRQIALNADGSMLNAGLDAAESAWTYRDGADAAAVRVPVAARFAVGDHVTGDLAVTAEGGQYRVSAPIAAADKGGQYLLTLLDAEGEPIRAFAGHVDDIELSGVGGDLTGDGKTNGKDIVQLQRFVAGGYGVALTDAAADLTGDGKVNGKDVVQLQRAVAGGYGVELSAAPVLRDDPHADDELNLLFIGNSFCYYWVEELYGLMDAAGFENVTICNVYYSGCSLKQHWTWLLSDAHNYEFYVTDKDGRRLVNGAASMEDCISYKNWDTVETQNGGKTGPGADGYRATVNAHLPLVVEFLIQERFPHADHYWLNSWPSEVARTGDSIESYEDQQRQIGYTLPFARELIPRFNMSYAPCGLAWQLVRGDARFTQLIDVDGRHLTTRIYQGRPDYDDYYHDGDVGGGQFLNACVWFETITHTSCLDNTYRPSYIFKGTDLSLSEEQIAFLKEAAHQAVLSEYGEDWYR